MPENILSVREIRSSDIPLIINYWQSASADYLNSMGAAIEKLPSNEALEQMLTEQIQLPYKEKKSYCIVWLVDAIPIGHCNVNKIVYGEEAFMHLHVWQQEKRKRGNGVQLVKMSLPYFFKNLKLKKLYCETYALNDAPNKTLERVGFTFIKEYITTPGVINFEQPVKQWELTKRSFCSDGF
jgi:RimJ/RimL family protein N-acetyltransferase